MRQPLSGSDYCGPTATWYLPGTTLLAWHVMDLMHTMFVAGLGIFLPAIVMLANRDLRRLCEQLPASAHVQSPEVGGLRP